VIAFEAVSHAYTNDDEATVAALIDISLRVEIGECVAVIGPSGCGKSTLLRLAAGLIAPDRGRILINDLELRPDTLMQARQRIGYVIQSGGLFPHLSALDNVTLAARYRKREAEWIETRLAELAELVQLPIASLSRYPKDLSGGQRQRVSLMRALMLDPDVLLLDEPLGALDPMVRHGLQEELRSLFGRLRKSVLLVTHDMAEAAFFSRHIVLMRSGRIVQQGAYEDLALSPADEFVSQFVRATRPLPALASA
jgi:osmoprotectant transport system ATP-binding protein